MLARFFVDRPIFAWVISIVILLVGGVAAAVLPIAQYPDITPPTVQVTANYPGASAQVVADAVAAPIEQQVNGVERMLYMSSQCTNDGAYVLTITFELGTDLNMAQVLVQNRVALAMQQLPREVQVQGVSTKKRSPSILLVVNLFSPDGSYDDLYLSNYATIFCKDELARIPGVGDLTFLGQRDYSMRVWLDPDKLAARELTAADVVNAISAQNVQVAAGQIGRPPIAAGQPLQLPLTTLGRLEEVEQFANIIVKASTLRQSGAATTSSQVVRVNDVARIELGAQQYDQISRLDGQPTVGVALFQLPGSNALATADAIKLKMEELKQRFPAGIDYRIVYDTTPFINESVNEVFKTLRDAVILVAIVVLFFLQDWKAMILPMIDVPVSLIGTFAVMVLLGFTLNNLTLFGLVLAIGIVVDDAIVVLENIERLIGTGLKAKEATIKAMDEVTGPIVAITLVLCSVFLPSAFIPGVVGQFYRQFALTIASAMVISAINAMTLTPARAVTIFRTDESQHGGGHGHVREALPWWFFGLIGAWLTATWLDSWFGAKVRETIALGGSSTGPLVAYSASFVLALPGLLGGGLLGWVIIKPVNRFLSFIFKGFNRLFDAIAAGYGMGLARVVRVSGIVVAVYGGLLGLTWWTMTSAPTGFIPIQDQGYLLVNIQLPDSASVERTSQVLSKLERILLGDDTGRYRGQRPAPGEKTFPGIHGVAHCMSVSGQSFLLNANGSNFGSAFVILEEFHHRRTDDTYDEAIAQQIRRLVAEEIDDAVIAVFRAPPIQGLGSAGGFKFMVEQRGFVNLPELQQTTDDIVFGGNEDPRLVGMFSMYRAEAPQLYIDIDRTKCESLAVDVTDVFSTLQGYMGGQFVNLFNKFGRTWQVNVMADAKYRSREETIGQLKVRNKLGDMVPLGTLATVKDQGGPIMVTRYNMYPAAAVNGNPGPGVSSGDAMKIVGELAVANNAPFEWTEITYLQLKAGNVTLLVFGLGTVLVYLVLAAKYESWRLPLAVILVVPMCLLCAVAGMLIVRLPVDIFVQIGFLVLVGLAAKNAVLIVEFAEQLRAAGKPFGEAIVLSSQLRLRPIIMTSFAFILGVLPLVISGGAGAEMRRSLGTAVFSGMIGVTAFGIILTPVFYYALTWLTQRKRLSTQTPAARAPEAPVPAPSAPGPSGGDAEG